MTELETLIATALIGTERQALPELPTAQGLNADSREENLLSAAALLTAYERAGYTPGQGTALKASPADSKPSMSAPVRHLLHSIVHEHQKLLEEFLELFKDHRFAHRDLPLMLEHGHKDTAVQAKIIPLLDARGRWLASLNPQWAWATGNTESIEASIESFETGHKGARVLALRSIREHDPERARTLLESTWKQEAASERADLIRVLETGLSQADEAFLENVLNDRSRHVREIAATLLSKLPQSQFNARTAERLRAILKVKQRQSSVLSFLKTQPKQLEIELPSDFDPSWAKDGIQEKAPPGTGKKQFWVQQILRNAPLSMLEEITGLDIITLLKNTSDDWRELIRETVQEAINRQPQAEFIKRIVKYDPLLIQNDQILHVLETHDLEAIVMQPAYKDDCIDPRYLSVCTHTWSEAFLDAVLEHTALRTERIRQGGNLTPDAVDIALYAPSHLITSILNGRPSAPNWTKMLSTYFSAHPESLNLNASRSWHWQYTYDQIQKTLQILQLRLKMYQLRVV